ncbi:MAG: response regulator transcription factor [Beijerinckiaceae bacterium]|jgi:DNA-binding NarL/FixJ family response regulator|nr:response regulator transcription factor [Beijerinckiaceae bacterium]MDO9441016.1 response regulator transcription factor [Beijerinckiaceae bacterium]
MTDIRVVHIDDHPVVLAGIAALVERAPGLALSGQATNGADALALVAETQPDVVIIDLSLPGLSGLDLAQQLTDAHAGVRLIALTVHESRAYVQPLLRAGARGYVLKRSAAEDLLKAIRIVAGGGIYVDPAVIEQALPESPAAAADRETPISFSPREEAVLRLTAQGFSNKEIAAQMSVGIKSVETYKARASLKASLRSRAEIVRYAAARGWLDQIGER